MSQKRRSYRSLRFSRKEESNLINIVKTSYQQLYDPNHEEYKLPGKLKTIFVDIGKKMKKPGSVFILSLSSIVCLTCLAK